jgi:hypothetical protein
MMIPSRIPVGALVVAAFLLAPLAARAGEQEPPPPTSSGEGADAWTTADADPDLAQPLAAAPLDAPYRARRALAPSLGVTLGGMALGAAVSLCVFATSDAWTLALGLGVAQAAQALGPSLGYFYLGDTGRATAGLILRTALGAVSTSMFSLLVYAIDDGDADVSIDDVTAIAVGSAAAFAASVYALIDLATLRRATRRANARALEEKEREDGTAGVAIAPFVAPGRDGATTAGLAFAMRF